MDMKHLRNWRGSGQGLEMEVLQFHRSMTDGTHCLRNEITGVPCLFKTFAILAGGRGYLGAKGEAQQRHGDHVKLPNHKFLTED